MKEKISELLHNRFSSVYCDTCESVNDERRCDECHRKSMNWALSKDAADRIAEEIIKEVGI